VNDDAIREYLTRPYSRVLTREPDGRFSAHVLEWPGCYGDGDTADEANASLEASMATWVSVMLEDDRPIPEPLAKDYSGRLLLRMSKDAHRRVSIRAQAEGVSVNQLVCSYVESGLVRDEVRSGVVWTAVPGRRLSPDRWLFSAHAAAERERVIVTPGYFLDTKATTPPTSLVVDDEGRWGIARDESESTTKHESLKAARRGVHRV